MLVLDDADPEAAAAVIAAGAFGLTGQGCTATSRAYVTPGVTPGVREALTAALCGSSIRDDWSPGSEVCMIFLVEVVGRLANPVHPEKTLEELGKLAADLHRSARPRQAPKASPRPASLSAGDKTNLVAAYRGGTSSAVLAAQYGIGKGTVLDLLDEHNVTKRRQPPGTEVLQRAADLYEEALPLATISSQLGIPQSTLRRHMHKQGVALRPRGGSKPKTAPDRTTL